MAEIPREIAEELAKVEEYFEHMKEMGLCFESREKLRQVNELFNLAREKTKNYKPEEGEIIQRIILQCKAGLLL